MLSPEQIEDLLIQHALAYCNKNDPGSSKDEKELRNRILAHDEQKTWWAKSWKYYAKLYRDFYNHTMEQAQEWKAKHYKAERRIAELEAQLGLEDE